MARKSLVQRAEVDQVLKAHNCQANSRHRLERGDKRLKIWNGRSPDHYCVACAIDIIEHDIVKLQELARQLRAEQSVIEHCEADSKNGRSPTASVSLFPSSPPPPVSQIP
jgi:hypothetical protein